MTSRSLDTGRQQSESLGGGNGLCVKHQDVAQERTSPGSAVLHPGAAYFSTVEGAARLT